MKRIERLKELAEGLHSEGGLGYRVRIGGDWDEEQFLELLSAAEGALDELGPAKDVPGWMAVFFASGLPALRRDMQVEAFARTNAGGTSAFHERSLLLTRLVNRFCNDSPKDSLDKIPDGEEP